MKKDKGVITAFFAVIMGIVIALLCSLIDFTRINSTKNQLVIASDAAITSALANYDKGLYEDYGLLSFEYTEEIDNVVKEIFEENIPENGLFDISVESEDIKVDPDDNIFLDNDLMKKQMVNSMMYQGTENLAMEVFQKIQQFLGTKNLVKAQEDLKDADKDAKKIEQLIKEMQEGKSAAVKLTVLLAKNQGYPTLFNKNIDFKTSINASDLKSKYSGTQYSTIIDNAINHLTGKIDNTEISANSYNGETKLLEAYSYAYTKMVLEMYLEFIDKYGSEEDKKLKEEIDAAIRSLKKADNINNSFDAFKKEFDDLFKVVETGKKAVNTLASDEKQKEIKEIIAEYRRIQNESNNEIGTMAGENADRYEEILSLDKLKEAELSLGYMYTEGTTLQSKISDIKANLNKLSSLGKEWIESEGKKGESLLLTEAYKFYEEFNTKITVDYIKNNKGNPQKLVEKICSQDTLKFAGDTIALNQLDMMSYIKKAYSNSSLTLDPKLDDNNNKYKNFYDLMKKEEEKEQKRDGLLTILNKYKEAGATLDGIDINSLPSNASSEEKTSEDVAEQMDKAGDLSNLGSMSFDKLINTLGGFVDKLYIVEYVMTNFKDMVELQENEGLKRIPEETTVSTKLNYEIESIIAGKYNDKEVVTTLMDEFFAIRFALNTVSIFKIKPILTFIKSVSATIAASTLGVVPEPVARYVLIAAWALLETNYDLIDIYNGYQVPILKESLATWITDFGLGNLNFDLKDIDDAIENISNSINEGNFTSKSGDSYYNKQKLSENDGDLEKIGLNYSDMIRFKLLISNENKIIDRVQDLITINKDIVDTYKEYNSSLEVGVNKSKVNILFTTDAFKSKGGEHTFNGFSFKRGYN